MAIRRRRSGTVRRPNIYLTGMSEGEERGNGTKAIFGQIIDETFRTDDAKT